jgi:hypothetical protein
MDVWATAAEHVIVEPHLHDDDTWTAYLQWYTTDLDAHDVHPSNPCLDLVPVSAYPY